MWAYDHVFYQIYPLGFCGAPWENDGATVNRIKKVKDWIPHIKGLGCDAIYFSPIFESDRHGYDTRDYRKLDCRLGANEDFAGVSAALHEAGIKVVLDGVFNHVGRGFWAFQDVLKNREQSPYKDWFYVNFGGNSNYNDGLWYEGWEGHFELVKLNLRNEAVISHLFDCVRGWAEEFQIDGLRLDVAYCLDRDFLKRLRSFCDGLKPDFFLVGEILGGDYKTIMNEEMLHSATNYECYKGLYSSFNSKNLFEIGHSLLRQFGPENWTLYKGAHLLSFADNHDVTRVASNLQNPGDLPLLYAVLCAMPGIPCIYYGSEWGALGKKQDGDEALRPSFDAPQETELTKELAKCIEAHKKSRALCFGDFQICVLQNQYMIFSRAFENERVLVAVNAADQAVHVDFDAKAGRARDLLSGEIHDFGGGTKLPAHSAFYWEVF